MTETEIQSAAIVYLKLHYPNLLISVSPAAGFKLNLRLAGKMIKMGYQKGTPDIIILQPALNYHGALIEIKTETGEVSKEQTKYLAQAKDLGYFTAVAYGYNQLINVLELYLAGATVLD